MAANDDIVEAIELQFAVEDIQNATKNSPANTVNFSQFPNLLAMNESSSRITADQLLLQVTNQIA